MSDFNFIYAEEHLSHREKAVYIYLRDRADASGVCWPGIKTIARELGLSPRTVQRALADLERRQLIEKRNRRRSNGSLTSNLYRLTVKTTRKTGGLHEPYKGLRQAAPKGAVKRFADRI